MQPCRLVLAGALCTALLTASCSVPARAGAVSTPAKSGVRNGVSSKLALIAGVFEIKRPYCNLDGDALTLSSTSVIYRL